MLLHHRKLYTSNVLICMAIALFTFFIVQTPLLYRSLDFVIKILVRIHFALLNNWASFTPTTQSLVLDICVVLSCAFFWTYQKTTTGKVSATLGLGILMIPVSIFLFNRFGILSISMLIIPGVALGMAMDATAAYLSVSFQRKIVEEKHDAEYNILRHLNHNVKPNIQMAKSPISAITSFMESRNLLDEPLAKRLDGSQETVREALDHAILSLEHISAILDSTRKLVTHEIRHSDFQVVDICDLLEREIIPRYASIMTITVQSESSTAVGLHRQSFIEVLLNLIRNAEVHGFQGDCSGAQLSFRVSERRNRIVIDYTNNGRPFPCNLTEKDFLTFGRKSGDSPGEGLGGAWIGKVIAAHNGSFEIIRDEHPLHFRIMLPKGGI